MIKFLQKFSGEKVSVPEHVWQNSGRRVNRYYQDKLIWKIILRTAGKLFLPMPVRCTVVCCRSARFIWKGVPMGFFNENSLGEVTGVCTTVLGNIETLVPMVLVDILGGVIGTVVFTAMIILFEWRVGLVALAGILLYFLVVSSMEKKSAAIAPNAQKSQTALTSAVLEYVQGMGIVKSFNLSGRGDKRAQDALEFNRKSNLAMEKLMTPYTILQELVLQAAGIAMMFVAVVCWADGAMSLANALMCIVMSFLVFGQVKLFGMGMSMLRLASASIDRTLQTEEMEQMDEKGRALRPGDHGIAFDNVRFSYDDHGGHRSFRFRQDHSLQPDRPLLGRGQRQRKDRRKRCAGIHAGVPDGADQHGVPECLPLCGYH